MPPRNRKECKTPAEAAKVLQTSMEIISDDGVHVQWDYLHAKTDCRSPLNLAHASEAKPPSQDLSEDNNHGGKFPMEPENQDTKTNPVIARNLSKNKKRNYRKSKTGPKLLSSYMFETYMKMPARSNGKNKCTEIISDNEVHHDQPYYPSTKADFRPLTLDHVGETLSTSQHASFSQTAVEACRKYLTPETQSPNSQDGFSKPNEAFLKSCEISEFNRSGHLQTNSYNVDKKYFEEKPAAMVDKHENQNSIISLEKANKQYISLLKCYKCKDQFLSQESMYSHYRYTCTHVLPVKSKKSEKNTIKNKIVRNPNSKIFASVDSTIFNRDRHNASLANISTLSSSHQNNLYFLSSASENSSNVFNRENVAPVVRS